MVKSPDAIADANVVCWEREEYLRTVIYLPIGCSGHGLGIALAASEFPLVGVAYTEHRVVLLHSVMLRKVACYQSRQPVVIPEQHVQGLEIIRQFEEDRKQLNNEGIEP